MDTIIQTLEQMSIAIGDDVSVDIEYEKHPDLEPRIIFRIDWPNNFHYRYVFSAEQVKMSYGNIYSIVVDKAREEYDKKINSIQSNS